MKLLCIDPGHGGSDPGGQYGGYMEKDLNLIIAKRLQVLLKEYSPDITRTTDVKLDPAPRANLIKDKYEYCLSIHFNMNAGDRIEGIHSIYSGKGKLLAEHITSALSEALWLPVNVFCRKGSNGDYYYMHRLTGKTCTVIVECLPLDTQCHNLQMEAIAKSIAFGFKTYINSLKPAEKPITNKPTFEKVALTDIVYLDPLSIYGAIVKKKGTEIKGDFVNGGFFDMATMVSVSALVVDGKLLCQRLPHDEVKRAHFIVYRDGSVQVNMIKDIDKEENLSNIHFAISGFNMFPINLKNEWWPDSIGRRDWRTVLGYNPSTKKIIIAVRPDSNAERGQQTLVNLGCDRGIGLDSGYSTNARMNGKDIRITDRVLHNIIRWKGE